MGLVALEQRVRHENLVRPPHAGHRVGPALRREPLEERVAQLQAELADLRERLVTRKSDDQVAALRASLGRAEADAASVGARVENAARARTDCDAAAGLLSELEGELSAQQAALDAFVSDENDRVHRFRDALNSPVGRLTSTERQSGDWFPKTSHRRKAKTTTPQRAKERVEAQEASRRAREKACQRDPRRAKEEAKAEA